MRRHSSGRKPWAKTVKFNDLTVGDMLIAWFCINDLLNTNYMSGNALSRSTVGTFDYRTWVWHSRLGCLIL